jgi:hypothetical protein
VCERNAKEKKDKKKMSIIITKVITFSFEIAKEETSII